MIPVDSAKLEQAAEQIHQLQKRIAALEAMLESIGAGGVEPLIAAPRQPLTDAQLHTLWLYAPVDNYTTHEELFKQAARHTERAHRIGTPNDSKTN